MIVNLNLLWSEFVEADRNVASFQQTRSKISLNLLSMIFLILNDVSSDGGVS